ncbi:MAG: methyltransferase [Bacteroidales bacterium]|nr:methyltransferase [Bacteroidales bacterium]
MFHFKQFSVEDSSSPMKVGTDAVLLGAWTPSLNCADISILDIGTGCGVIALMLAQRISNANIQAIDIDSGACYNAKENFSNSIWRNRLNIHECSIQSFCESTNSKFNIIVSNPPFFEESLKSNKTKRNLARHTDSLPFQTMIKSVDYLMNENGMFACILPFNEGNKFIDLAKTYNLFCTKKMLVSNKPSQTIKRILFCLSRKEVSLIDTSTLFIRDEDNSYSKEYLNLTKDFYTFI